MSNPMYDHSIPVFAKMPRQSRGGSRQGAKHCEAEKIDPNAVRNATPVSDMFPLTRTGAGRGGSGQGRRRPTSRWIDVPNTKTRKRLRRMKARIAKTIAFVNGVKTRSGREQRRPRRHATVRGNP